jgi:hypothetical protein
MVVKRDVSVHVDLMNEFIDSTITLWHIKSLNTMQRTVITTQIIENTIMGLAQSVKCSFVVNMNTHMLFSFRSS